MRRLIHHQGLREHAGRNDVQHSEVQQRRLEKLRQLAHAGCRHAPALLVTFANIQHRSGVSLFQVANWQLAPIATVAKARQLRRHHRSLAFVEPLDLPAAAAHGGDGAFTGLNTEFHAEILGPASTIECPGFTAKGWWGDSVHL